MTLEETLDYVNNKTVLEYPGEIWKEHPTYKGYWGSNYGRVKRDNKIRTQNKYGCFNYLKFYVQIGYRKEKLYAVSRFILECFGHNTKDLEVDHINSICYDNKIGNLRLLTHAENVKNGTTINKRAKQYNHTPRPSVEYDLEKELWRHIPNHPSYEVSNMARFRNLNEKFIYGSLSPVGYRRIVLDKKVYRVHQIVGQCFIPNPNNYKYVKHKNGNLDDNRIENLYWAENNKK